jgi:hypothetical protein
MSGELRFLVNLGSWFRDAAGRSIRQTVGPMIVDAAVREVVGRAMRTSTDRHTRDMQGRQEAADAALARLSERTRALEEGTERRLREHADQLAGRLDASAAQTRDETREAVRAELAEQERTVLAAIDVERRERRDAVAALRSDVDELVGERASARAAAVDWLADAQAVHDLIEATLPHRRYSPGAVDGLARRLATARSTLADGHAQAALSAAQDAYHDLRDLRVDVELRHRDWVVASTDAAEALLTVQSVLERDTDFPVHGADGAELEGVRFDLRHWSAGELEALRAEVAGTLAAVGDEASPMGTPELRDVVDGAVPAYWRRWDEVVERAEMRLLGSQLRWEIADQMVTTLDQVGGYVLRDQTYAGGDERSAYYAKLSDPGGNEIVVEVAPEPDDVTGNRARVLSYDRDASSEQARRARSEEILSLLRSRGIEISNSVCLPGEADPAPRDLDAVRAAPAQAPAPASLPSPESAPASAPSPSSASAPASAT